MSHFGEGSGVMTRPGSDIQYLRGPGRNQMEHTSVQIHERQLALKQHRCRLGISLSSADPVRPHLRRRELLRSPKLAKHRGFE
jgi:hypothetical protein